MSVKQIDPALERLNYFNGQRLVANDLRAEQGHHVGMRRVLNRSLYSAGIVVGLEVEPAAVDPTDPTWKHKVLIRRGLAFDSLGREIFVPMDMTVLVMGAPSTTPGVVFGNLLTVCYRENRKQPVSDRCAVGSPGKPCSGDLPWGAPSRIVADAVFESLDAWPADDSGKIVLGQVELNAKCEVVRVMPGVRRYASPVKAQVTQPLAIEGEKDIDRKNAKRLYFHVNDGVPETATLYLRGRPFSTLYYTEMGGHTHTITIPPVNYSYDHAHVQTGPFQTVADNLSQHRHTFHWDGGNWGAFDMNGATGPDPANGPLVDETWAENPIHSSGAHNHTLGPIVFAPLVNPTGTLNITGSETAVGVGDVHPRPGPGSVALTAIDYLQIYFDGTDITKVLCDQLEARPGEAGKWLADLGVLPAHDYRMKGPALMASTGTGAIDLLKVGVEFGLGEHSLEFRVASPDQGGNLQYNLYVR